MNKVVKYEKAMPLIFLDIDGVLNTHDINPVAESSTIERSFVNELNRILILADARIVLSSAWRYMVIGKAMSVIGFDYLLRTHGVVANRLVGITPADEETSERGWQIQQWRLEHDHCGRYVVIDDMDLHISKLHAGHFVMTDSAVGLRPEDADEAIRILGWKPQTKTSTDGE